MDLTVGIGLQANLRTAVYNVTLLAYEKPRFGV